MTRVLISGVYSMRCPVGLVFLTLLMLQGCGEDADGTPNLVEPPQSTFTLSGKVTFERVFFDANGRGLDYSTRQAMPARRVQIELRDAEGNLVNRLNTDTEGNYSFRLTAPGVFRVVVKARLADADIRVTDNTSGNSLYELQGSLATTGTENSVRNLHASTGWGTSAFITDRAAAPFAILDTAYGGISSLQDVNSISLSNLPDLEFRWSVNNRPTGGERTLADLINGDIGSSFYSRSLGVIYLLGAASNDTDEFDQHVVMHELIHYFQDHLSRSDSIGGNHSLGDQLDLRLAFSEGMANAFSAILLGDPDYRDSSGANQSREFSISIESQPTDSAGWYSETTVQELIYDLYDQNADNADNVSLGVQPIWQALISTSFLHQPSLASIYSFLDTLTVPLDSQAAVANLVAANQIVGQGIWGDGETNNGGVIEALPVYVDLPIGEARSICVDNAEGYPNKLGNRRLVRIENPAGSRIVIRAESTTPQATDPDMSLFSLGQCEAWAISGNDGSEALVTEIEGTLVVEFQDWNLLHPEELDAALNGPTCFDLSASFAPAAILSGACGVFPAVNKAADFPQLMVKPGAAVDLDFRDNTGLTPGVPKQVQLAFLHQYQQGRGLVSLTPPDGVQLSPQSWQLDLASANHFDLVTEVLAAVPGRHYIAADVEIERNGLIERRAFSIPLDVIGDSDFAGSGEVSTEVENSGVHTLPVEEDIIY